MRVEGGGWRVRVRVESVPAADDADDERRARLRGFRVES